VENEIVKTKIMDEMHRRLNDAHGLLDESDANGEEE
jgi:hypothetical protein